jgi:hypothetical protein
MFSRGIRQSPGRACTSENGNQGIVRDSFTPLRGGHESHDHPGSCCAHRRCFDCFARFVVRSPRTFSLYLATRGEDVARALRLAKTELETRADVFTLDALAWAWMANGNAEQAWIFAQRAVAEGTQDARPGCGARHL